MQYGVRLANGEVQVLTGATALTNELTDGLLEGAAVIVCLDGNGNSVLLDALSPMEASGRSSSSLQRGRT